MHVIDETREHRRWARMEHWYVEYLDTKEIIDMETGLVVDTMDPDCNLCGKKRTKDGHDPCIANLPGVKFACCGHGTDQGYIFFENGTIIYGKFGRIIMNADTEIEETIYTPFFGW